MSEQADRDALVEVLTAHHAHVGPVSGAWLCACGAESTNGSIRTGDLTTRAGRCAEHDAHVAGALLAALAQRDRRVAAEAWSQGHAAGRDYVGDGWNSDAHDPEDDNPYREARP